MPPSSVLIIGASRGLGLALTKHYTSSLSPSSSPPDVYATIRGDPTSTKGLPEGVHVIGGIDLSQETVSEDLVRGLEGKKVDVVYIVAGLLKTETFGEASWGDQVDMYKICAIAPVMIVQALATHDLLAPRAKILLLTSEAGSLSLRTPKEGGGNYGHHGSKAAGNMAGRLLSYDLKEKGVGVVMIHPGFLKTEMTKAAGFEQHYEEMGAVTPEEAAKYLAEFAETVTMEMSGKLWAPMGGRGIGNAKALMGPQAAEQTTPLELPW
ncbi:uncharacterized protein MKK02DRAFT_42150 [Dioszegia hungarica]|uniref:Oxidoreductase n=1 Tax=Dioszegia hungarica TaxID=4972 RepID=A0AA38HF39_9TREE|nr:uncharacterized protein MKK02DRAFT_42150 [Dioszegia hungarica]KAI9637779.1 hypothetical protein MKK02DRAFT_42150 [Dioszegia hungarica]